MMVSRIKSVALMAGMLGLALAAGEARAGFTVTLDTVSGSGPYTYSYSAAIAPDDQVVTGDFFRIYDFYGYVAGSATAPAGWTASVANSNPVPPPNVVLGHGDDPTVPNLTWTYTGATPLNPGDVLGLAFTAQSIYPLASPVTLKDFTGRDTKATGDVAGSKVDSVGSIRVPGVPEPASVISTSLGVLLCGALYGFRSRRALRA